MPRVLETKMCVRDSGHRGRGGGGVSGLLELQSPENQEGWDNKKLQAKRRPSQRHMRSMPSVYLKGKNGGGGAGGSFGEERDDTSCQVSFSATVKSYVKKSKPRRITVTARH